MLKILIVEDNAAISDIICINLQKLSYICTAAYDGSTACDLIDKDQYDLILLDIMLPDVDGYDVMDYIRPLDIPVIFITAKGTLKDRIKGLHMGADDYIVKPFETEELIARVEAVLRRAGKGKDFLEFESVQIDTLARTVKCENRTITLTAKEFDILVLLVQNKGRIIYRERLYERVWGEEWSGETRTVDQHIQRLRQKMGWKDKIKTVHKLGYKLEESK